MAVPKLNLLGNTREGFAYEAERSRGPFFTERKTAREPSANIERSIFIKEDARYKELSSLKDAGRKVVPLVGRSQRLEAVEDPDSTAALRFEGPGEAARREKAREKAAQASAQGPTLADICAAEIELRQRGQATSSHSATPRSPTSRDTALWKESLDWSVRRLMADFELTDAPMCRLNHLDRMHNWYAKHTGKHMKQEEVGSPAYTMVDRTPCHNGQNVLPWEDGIFEMQRMPAGCTRDIPGSARAETRNLADVYGTGRKWKQRGTPRQGRRGL